jgi:hypothetical protein
MRTILVHIRLMILVIACAISASLNHAIAVVTVDGTVSTNTAGATVSSITVNHTTGAGDNRLMLLGVSWNAGTTARTISSVTFTPSGGSAVSLTEVKTQQVAPTVYRYAAIYRLLNPPSSQAGTVTVTFSGSVSSGIVVGVANFAGVDQTTPLGSSGGAAATNATPTVTLSGLGGDELVFDTVFLGGGPPASLTPDASQTRYWTNYNTNARGAASSKQATGSSVTMSWTAGSSTAPWAIAAVPMKPAGADTTSPTVTINQAAGQSDPTTNSSINFTVVFSEPVTDFATGDVTLSGTAGATTATVSGSGTTYNVAVSGMTGSGTVIASLDAAVAHDAAGNPSDASTSTDNTVTYDVTAPTVTINQAAGQADPTSASPINFTVEFSKTVTDFAAGDVTLSGTAGATTATVTGSGTTYNVAVSGMTVSGTVIASLAPGVAHDTAGNPNETSTSTDDTVTYSDTTPPTVTINQAVGQADPTSASPINLTVVFSEPVADFATGDVTLDGTAGATTATVTGSGTTYNVAVSGMTGSGTVIASVNAGVAQDASGNGNTASTSTDDTVTYDATAPTVTINQAAGQADPTGVSPINFTVVFSEAVTDFATGDVTLSGTATNGATTATVTGSGTAYNVAVSGMTNAGTVIASIAAGVAHDAAGNPNTAGTSTDNEVTYAGPKITLDGAVSMVKSTNTVGSSLTVTNTTGTGNNRLMLVGLSWNANTVARTILSVTFTPNGEAPLSLTEVKTQQPGTMMYRYASIYSLTNPPSGQTGTVTVTFSGSVTNGIIVGVASFAGVDQTTPLGTPTGAGATNTAPAVTLTGLNGDELLFDTVFIGGNPSPLLNNSTSQTRLWTNSTSNAGGAASTKPATAGSVTMSWTASGSGPWAIAAVPIKPAAGDTTPPIITTCASNITINAAANCQAALPDLTTQVVASDESGGVTITQSPVAGTLVGLGDTVVTLTVTDAATNQATCEATVTVVDVTAPEITACATNVTINADMNCQAAIPDLTTQVISSEECPGAVTITQSPAAGTLVGRGDTVVTLTVKDVANNEATCQATVTVVDVTAPEITACATNMTLNADTNCQAAIPDLTTQVIASDGCTGTVTITQSPLAGTLVGLGDTVVTLTVKDAADNQTNCQATITVVDGFVPDLMEQPQSATNMVGTTATFTVAATSCSAIGYQWMRGTNLLSGENATTLTITNVQTSNAGDYTVVLTNGAGSATSEIATLTVLLPAAPTASARPVLLPNGHFSASYQGTPNVPYTVKYAEVVTGPWHLLTNVTSDANGLIPIDDLPPVSPGRRFYRVVYP